MSSFHPPNESQPTTLPLTIRFTTSIPDLHLSIPSTPPTTVIALKHQIRTSLPPPTSTHRYRLIHSGKLLNDTDILSKVLKTPPPPPPADPKGKGKEKEVIQATVYINCSIGDVLSPAELAAEEIAATTSLKTHERTNTSNKTSGGSNGEQVKTTTASPRGFDRLLSGGFTPAEVNQLRLQFLSIQSSIHTPETMPSPSTLLLMEDAWIDDNNGAGAGGGTGGGVNGGFDFGDEGLGGGALDDLLWGNIVGFLWPLGCVGWLIREGGVWSRRRQIAVFTGFMLSVSFGMLRVMS